MIERNNEAAAIAAAEYGWKASTIQFCITKNQLSRLRSTLPLSRTPPTMQRRGSERRNEERRTNLNRIKSEHESISEYRARYDRTREMRLRLGGPAPDQKPKREDDHSDLSSYRQLLRSAVLRFCKRGGKGVRRRTWVRTSRYSGLPSSSFFLHK